MKGPCKENGECLTRNQDKGFDADTVGATTKCSNAKVNGMNIS